MKRKLDSKYKERLEQIAISTCSHFEVELDDMLGTSRYDDYVEARQYYCYIAKEVYNIPHAQIGALMGKDHSTSVYSCQKINGLMRIYQGARDHVTSIMNGLFEFQYSKIADALFTLSAAYGIHENTFNWTPPETK